MRNMRRLRGRFVWLLWICERILKEADGYEETHWDVIGGEKTFDGKQGSHHMLKMHDEIVGRRS